jgi:anaerobic magnesium-protoporphyrin IX monomethyl ester cyclase
MNILLIFPPVFNPTQPYLAPFTVAGHLRALTGCKVDVLDWSIESYHLLIDPEFIGRVATARGATLPPSLLARLAGAWDALRLSGEPYHDAVAAIDEAFVWYQSAFPRIRLARYCGMEAIDWPLDASQDLIGFAGGGEDNLFSALYDAIVVPRLRQQQYDAIGLSLVCQDQLCAAATLALRLRQERGPRLVLGGPLATMLAAQPRHPHLFDLFDHVHDGSAARSLSDTFGLPTRPTASALTEWILPDWRDVDWDRYLAPAPVVPVQATSGCPYSCKFCSSPAVALAIDGVRYRQRPAGAIAAEIEAHAAQGRRYFLLVGEMLTWPHATAIGEQLAARHLTDRVAWYFWTRTTPTPPASVLAALRAHGCRRICFGLETADAHALVAAGKQTPRDDALNTLLSVVRADIQPHLFLMTGLPGQHPPACDEDLLRLIDALVAAGAYGVTTTVSAFEPEEWSPWAPLPLDDTRETPRRDLRVKAPATAAAERHATQLRAVLHQRLSRQPFLGAFGNVHQLVFLDRVQASHAGGCRP